MQKTVLLFPGQGSQCQGMGRDLAEVDSSVMELWKEAERISGLQLREIYWEGDETAMNDTRVVQPALTVVNCALWQSLHGHVEAHAAAGHSLGEWSALACAGVFSFADALKLTSLRGKLMAEADPAENGAMAAVVKLSSQTVAEIAQEAAAESGQLLLPANYNTPVQTVLSGTKKAIELACAKVKERKGRAILLKVSGAFHSPMMAEANQEFVKQMAKVHWQTARFPIYGNVDGEPESDGARLQAKLAKQMISPVLWVASIEAMYRDGLNSFLEIGPKSLLLKMVGQCLEGKEGLKSRAVTDVASVQTYLEEDCHGSH